MAAHMSKWQLICGTYTHKAKNTIYIVAVRYDVLITLFVQPCRYINRHFGSKYKNGSIYVCQVRYMSALSDICLICQIYVQPFRYINCHFVFQFKFGSIYVCHVGYISGWLDIYRDISSYVRPIETLAPKKPDI